MVLGVVSWVSHQIVLEMRRYDIEIFIHKQLSEKRRKDEKNIKEFRIRLVLEVSLLLRTTLGLLRTSLFIPLFYKEYVRILLFLYRFLRKLPYSSSSKISSNLLQCRAFSGMAYLQFWLTEDGGGKIGSTAILSLKKLVPEGILDHMGDDAFKNRTAELQARICISFDQPRAESFINHKIESKNFKIISQPSWI